jgi:hypothetical protein
MASQLSLEDDAAIPGRQIRMIMAAYAHNERLNERGERGIQIVHLARQFAPRLVL